MAAGVNSFPWLADILPLHFEKNRSFVGTNSGTIYMDPAGRDLSCIDGKPPD